MTDGKVRIIWEEKKGSRSSYYGGVDTTFPDVLSTWAGIGKKPDEFNALIIDAMVKPHLSVPCILWCSGYEIGVLFNGLRERGLCRDIPVR